MSGALIDLVSKGVQDAYLTGDPQVSFYRQNYKRYTNFAMKPVELNKVGTSGPNTECVFKIDPAGDLLTYVWCDVTDVGVATETIQVSEARTPTEFALYIGGMEVDRQDGFFINSLWPKFLATTPSKCVEPSTLSPVFFPLHFFSCDNITTPIPLVALQYHGVEIKVRSGTNVGPSTDKFKMYGNYVMLDTEERKWFTDNQHEMLITQTQRIQADASGSDLSYLNHPVKGLFWGQATDDTLVTTDVQLNLNGTSVFNNNMPAKYFNTVSMYQHSENAVPKAAGSITNDTSQHMYSFATAVNKHQPTGTCNFSRLDNAKFTWTGTGGTGTPTYLYGVNYNILKIKDGLGGVMFSN